MTETKTDVAETVLSQLLKASIDAYGPDDDGVVAATIQEWRARYAAAPAEVVKVPKIVYDYIDRIKREDETAVIHTNMWYLMADVAHHLNQDNAPDVQAENWIIDHGDQFATAWLAWPNVEVEE